MRMRNQKAARHRAGRLHSGRKKMAAGQAHYHQRRWRQSLVGRRYAAGKAAGAVKRVAVERVMVPGQAEQLQRQHDHYQPCQPPLVPGTVCNHKTRHAQKRN